MKPVGIVIKVIVVVVVETVVEAYVAGGRLGYRVELDLWW